MAGVDFTREDVVEQAGVDPWETADDFADEIDLEEMAAASRGFAEAAGEAGSASEVAARASELSQDAATTDGIGHHNADEHITITEQDLQGGGQDIQDVADIINSATELAGETKESVSILRSDAVGKFHEHLTDARTTYQNKHAELQESVDAVNIFQTPSVTVAGTVYDADGGRIDGWSFPQAALDAIREHYLGKAAEDITSLHGDMETEIEDYRGWMLSRAGELTDLGYDVGAGPHNLWHTEEMAEYAAEGIEEEMAKPEDERDLDRIATYTEGLAAIGLGVYDPADPTTPRRDLTREEREYLHAFYDNLDEDTLAALGDLAPGTPGGPDVGAGHEHAISNQWDQIHGIQAALGNGINMLMNPEIGGLNIDAHPSIDGPVDIPESIRAFVYDADGDLRDAESLDEQRGVLNNFNGFGALMDQATVPPGDSFAHHLTASALDVQEVVHAINVGAYNDAAIAADGDPPTDLVMPDFLENTGSSGLLSNVALNTDASFEILSNENTRDELLGAVWADSDGVGDLVRSAVLPTGGESDGERRALADTVIQHFTDSPAMLVEDWNEATNLMYGHYPWDTSGLQGAVSDATLSRLDAIVGLEGAEGVWDTEDRYAAFSLMAATDESVYEHFKSGVYDAQRNMAYEYYANGSPQEGDQLNTLQSIANLTGLMEWGERDVINWYEGREDAQAAQQQKMAKATLSAALGVTGTLAPGAYGTAVSLGTTGYGLVDPVLFPDYKPQEPGAQAAYTLDEHEINTLMEQRALTAGAIDAHNEQASPENQLDVMSPEEAIASWNGAGTPHIGLNENANGISYRSDDHTSVADALPHVHAYGADESLDYDKTKESLSASARYS
ncbi:hypothetical protein RM844_08025 [Streptomyces sp. DSM 44915]|uniref:TPR repeat domain-containing protein n=1 Tax=Streptomyces chisholmiae TaxID=3075540 RepID=A0ABU2JNB8_9ACTN|nr:hypothetical protein [Streptomyces sp. DSM 44915]MDT0266241.1 hypothetical protein [Streptomyces sp. DSM 44915]